jgi:hypothetical protein
VCGRSAFRRGAAISGVLRICEEECAMNTSAAALLAYTAGEVPRLRCDRWALIAGVAGIAANLLLVLFFALAR